MIFAVTKLQSLVYFATPEHECSYLEGRLATTVFVDPTVEIDFETYSRLSLNGFRRSGNHYYKPKCEACSACIPVRIPVAHFRLSKSQKRIVSRNKDLRVNIRKAEYNPRHFALYEHYINSKHADGDMYPPSLSQFENFLLEARPETEFVEFLAGEELLAVAVIDHTADGLSAIYTFYDSRHARRSLGVFAVLWQIAYANERNVPYLYLGYWIRGCQKMSYKTNYRPLEMLVHGRWLGIG
ncbi:arginyltransferase [Allohahella marinimesophila]|uniref:Aspartate/glutamate leucyltransferase n=1 Tax=Allohahella marinimesophila TaxID=1054972 RepID=A0ABP7NMU5_9GAMM